MVEDQLIVDFFKNDNNSLKNKINTLYIKYLLKGKRFNGTMKDLLIYSYKNVIIAFRS